LALLLVVGGAGGYTSGVLRVEQVAQARREAYHDALGLASTDVSLTLKARVVDGKLRDTIEATSGPCGDLFGWSPDELQGRSIEILIGNDSAMAAAHTRAMAAAVKRAKIGDRSAIRCSITRRDGQLRPVIVLSTVQQVSDSGEVTYDVRILSLLGAVAIDLTQAEERDATLRRILSIVEELRDSPRNSNTITVQQGIDLAELIREGLEADRLKQQTGEN
jgi:PAS domain-containing protein